MATKTFKLFKVSDKNITDMFAEMLKEMGWKVNLSFSIESGLPEITCTLEALGNNQPIQNVLSQDSQIFRRITCSHVIHTSHVSLSFSRNDADFDSLQISTQDHNPQFTVDDAVKIFSTVNKYIKVYNAEENVSKILGPELEKFYVKREEGLLRLEGLSQKLIEANEAFRVKLDTENLEKRKELQQENKSHKDKLDAVYKDKDAELKKREETIDEKLKKMDDLNNRDSRRKLREQMKAMLAERNKEFNLTKSTIWKRLPIHGLFILIIITLGTLVFFGKNIFKAPAAGSAFEIISWIESPFFIISLVVTTIFYIRWNDRWAQMHADEEFRLKRLDLDIDRASWVVEMAMEWKDEKQKDIPKELLDKLTHNLFEDMIDKGSVRHPYEDVIRGLLNVSAEARIPIPGGGSLKVDKKGLQELAKG